MRQLNLSRKFSLVAVAAIVSALLVTAQQPLAAQNCVLDPNIARPAMALMHPIHEGFQLYWDTALVNSAVVTDFDLQYRAFNTTTEIWGTWNDVSFTGTGRMTLLTGLTAGTKYQTRIRAYIGNRCSNWSTPSTDNDPADTSTARDFESSGQADPPTVPTVTVSAGKFTVSWTNPGTSNNSVATTGYQVGWRTSDSEGMGTLLAATATSYEVTGLVGGKTYELWVVAYANNNPSYSPIPDVVTFQSAPPASDPSTLTLSASPNPATEGTHATVRVTATLDHAAKAGGVPVTLTAASGSTATASSDYTLPNAFTISEGNKTATADVTIANDALVELQETLKLSATTTTSGITVTGTTVTINDDDAGGAKIAFHASNAASTSEYTASVNENAGTLNVPVTISHLPAASTTFVIEVLNTSTATENTDYSITTKSVTFASSSSDTVKTKNLQISITDDSIDDDSETIKLRIKAARASTHNDYEPGDRYTRHSAGATATVTIADNDAPGITLSKTSVSLTEAAGTSNSDTYTVRLNTQPSHNVVISVSSSDNGAAAVSPSSRTFTSTNWSTAQTFTVTAQSDADADNETATISHSAASTDTSYNGGAYTAATDKVAVTVADDDAPGITLSKTSVSLTEAAGTSNSDTYTVRLNTQPSHNVVISVSSSDNGAAAVSPSSRTFTSTNWSTAQTFTVTAQSDADADNETATISHSAASTDTSYNGGAYTAATDKVAVTVTDDDTPGGDPPDNNGDDDDDDDDNDPPDNNNDPPDNNDDDDDDDNGPPDDVNFEDIVIDIGDAIADTFEKEAGLRALEISSGNLHFDPNTYSYQVDVPHSTSIVTVTATPNSFLAAITVSGRPTPRGRPSHEIVLSEDPTIVQVIVRAKIGTTEVYTITVHRVDS